jgi:hypothetical protein
MDPDERDGLGWTWLLIAAAIALVVLLLLIPDIIEWMNLRKR